ncbi:MAG TPA: ion channel [Myxococcales bacterium]|nr:ion channel [Myxococcales bacterium]
MSAEPSKFVSQWRGLRFLQLLLFIVAALLLFPFLARFRIAVLAIQILILNGILVAISATRRGATRRLLIGACVGDIALEAISRWVPAEGLPLVADAASAIVLALCVTVILAHVFRSSEITADTILAAIVAYLFLAIAFSRAFVIVESVSPTSFDLRAGVNAEFELLYFSFITIATLGYGDVVPRLPTAQILAMLEAVIGQFYVAVLIAWLVSVHAGGRGRGR